MKTCFTWGCACILSANLCAQQLYQHDFGTLSTFDTLWHTFNYLNNSPDTVHVRKHQSSCECILSEPMPTHIPPMKELPVRMGFPSAYRWGDFEKTWDWLRQNGDTIRFVLSGHIMPQPDSLHHYFRHATDSLLWPERGLRALGHKTQNHFLYSAYTDTLHLSLQLSDSLWKITPSLLLVRPKQLTRFALQRLPLPQNRPPFRIDTLFLYRQNNTRLGELPVSWSP